MTRNTSFLADDTGVSPVIGVILMVAITVILAAVIGAFVLDLGNNVSETAPQASLRVGVSADNITVEHTGGDPISAEGTRITVTDDTGTTATFNTTGATGTLTVGGSAEIDPSSSGAISGGWQYGTPDGAVSITTGETYTVKFIDVNSQQIISQSKVTA